MVVVSVANVCVRVLVVGGEGGQVVGRGGLRQIALGLFQDTRDRAATVCMQLRAPRKT